MEKYSVTIFIVFSLIIMMMFPAKSMAWFNDPKINSVIEPVSLNQIEQKIISDGAGGAIITWTQSEDACNTMFDIYTQRIDLHGEPVWSASVATVSVAGSQSSPEIIPSGTGGAIIVWIDSRSPTESYDIYAQCINAQGQVLWPLGGVPITTAAESQVHPVIVSDSLGGAIIAWDDAQGNNSKIYAQRISQNGTVIWQEDGVIVADTNYTQLNPDITSDGQGGAIIGWTQVDPLNCMNIHAQRLDANGVRLWTEVGHTVCNVVGHQHKSQIASDDIGGAFISWVDGRFGDDNANIYAQRIAANGAMLWTEQGVPVTNLPGIQINHAIARDPYGGAIVVWEDGRKQTEDRDIYAQKLAPQGDPLWDIDGASVVTTEEYQSDPTLISDGSGGAFITWQDFYREGIGWNIYAQHIDVNGQSKWEQDGIPICIADGNQISPSIISDGSTGAIISWSDGRSGTYYNIFAQQIDSLGLLGGGEFKFYTSDIHGNPKDSFEPNELIFFRASWTMPTPDAVGTYSAGAMMVINSETAFRQETVNYDVKPDLNADSKVNLLDFSMLADEWGDVPVKADLNNDDKVDLEDLRRLLQQWLSKE